MSTKAHRSSPDATPLAAGPADATKAKGRPGVEAAHAVRRIGPRTLAALVGLRTRESLPAKAASAEFAALVSSPEEVLIVDVRGSDRPRWGWIPGALNVPSNLVTREYLASLAQPGSPAAGKKIVVFHCLHSKHRAVWASTTCLSIWQDLPRPAEGEPARPVICLLQGGFKAWLEAFLNEPDLTTVTNGVPSAMLARMHSAKPWQADKRALRAKEGAARERKGSSVMAAVRAGRPAFAGRDEKPDEADGDDSEN